jgi:hypothetical protein
MKMRYCLLLLTAMVARVGSAQTTATPVYACVQISGNVLETFNLIGDGGTCPEGQTRMLVVAARPLPFAASTPLAATENQVLFLARFMNSPIRVLSVDALTIAVTLDVMTDRGMYTIPEGLACVPLVDGQPAGDPLALTAPGRVAGTKVSPPDTLWPIAREATVSATGAHMVSIECAAASAFYFRGHGMLTVLQRVGGN